MAPKNIRAFIDKSAAAALAGVSTSTIARLTASGKLTSFRLGRRRVYPPDLVVHEVLVAGKKGPGAVPA